MEQVIGLPGLDDVLQRPLDAVQIDPDRVVGVVVAGEVGDRGGVVERAAIIGREIGAAREIGEERVVGNLGVLETLGGPVPAASRLVEHPADVLLLLVHAERGHGVHHAFVGILVGRGGVDRGEMADIRPASHATEVAQFRGREGGGGDHLVEGRGMAAQLCAGERFEPFGIPVGAGVQALEIGPARDLRQGEDLGHVGRREAVVLAGHETVHADPVAADGAGAVGDDIGGGGRGGVEPREVVPLADLRQRAELLKLGGRETHLVTGDHLRGRAGIAACGQRVEDLDIGEGHGRVAQLLDLAPALHVGQLRELVDLGEAEIQGRQLRQVPERDLDLPELGAEKLHDIGHRGVAGQPGEVLEMFRAEERVGIGPDQAPEIGEAEPGGADPRDLGVVGEFELGLDPFDAFEIVEEGREDLHLLLGRLAAAEHIRAQRRGVVLRQLALDRRSVGPNRRTRSARRIGAPLEARKPPHGRAGLDIGMQICECRMRRGPGKLAVCVAPARTPGGDAPCRSLSLHGVLHAHVPNE